MRCHVGAILPVVPSHVGILRSHERSPRQYAEQTDDSRKFLYHSHMNPQWALLLPPASSPAKYCCAMAFCFGAKRAITASWSR